jgi:hypothetical protein
MNLKLRFPRNRKIQLAIWFLIQAGSLAYCLFAAFYSYSVMTHPSLVTDIEIAFLLGSGLILACFMFLVSIS